MFGEPREARTPDPVIKSHVLYRLSYWLIFQQPLLISSDTVFIPHSAVTAYISHRDLLYAVYRVTAISVVGFVDGFLPHFRFPPTGNSLPVSTIASLSLVNASQGRQYGVGFYKERKTHAFFYVYEYFHRIAHSRSFPMRIFTVNNLA